MTREVLGVDFGDLAGARRGRLSGWFHLSPRDLPYPYRDVTIETPLGPAPAWLVPAEGGPAKRWVINVHGRAVRRSETLRAVEPFRDAGYTTLMVSYRNDGDAPRSDDLPVRARRPRMAGHRAARCSTRSTTARKSWC